MPVRGEAGLGTNCTVSRVFLDTYVLAYLFDQRSPDKQRRAEHALRSGHEFVISTQVLLELHAVLTRKFEPPVSAPDVLEILASLQKFTVLSTDGDLVIEAAKTAAAHQLSIWDAMIVEAARHAGCAELWTEDLAGGATIRGVRIVNPVLAD